MQLSNLSTYGFIVKGIHMVRLLNTITRTIAWNVCLYAMYICNVYM